MKLLPLLQQNVCHKVKQQMNETNQDLTKIDMMAIELLEYVVPLISFKTFLYRHLKLS